MTVLSQLLHQSNVQGWSNREISVRAEKNGHKLSRASVDVYMGGRHGRPTEAVLAAFSDVLNIPINKLRTAAGVPVGEGSPWAPPSEANRLDLRQRRALEELIRSMVASENPREDQDDDQHHPDTPDYAPAERRSLEGPPVADGLTSGAQHPDAASPVDTNRGGQDADPNASLRQRKYENGGSANDRPWEQDEYGLAAKRGTNRGRAARELQDRQAEEGGA